MADTLSRHRSSGTSKPKTRRSSYTSQSSYSSYSSYASRSSRGSPSRSGYSESQYSESQYSDEDSYSSSTQSEGEQADAAAASKPLDDLVDKWMHARRELEKGNQKGSPRRRGTRPDDPSVAPSDDSGDDELGSLTSEGSDDEDDINYVYGHDALGAVHEDDYLYDEPAAEDDLHDDDDHHHHHYVREEGDGMVVGLKQFKATTSSSSKKSKKKGKASSSVGSGSAGAGAGGGRASRASRKSKASSKALSKHSTAGSSVSKARKGRKGKKASSSSASSSTKGSGRFPASSPADATAATSVMSDSVLSSRDGDDDDETATDFGDDSLVDALKTLKRHTSKVMRGEAGNTPLVSIGEVHSMIMSVARASALRDAYRTIQSVTSDVPLAQACLGKPHNGALEEVVGALMSLRCAMETQLEAAKKAIERGVAGPPAGIATDFGFSDSLSVRQSMLPSPTASSGVTGSTTAADSRPSSAETELELDIRPESYLFPSHEPPVSFYGDDDFAEFNATLPLHSAPARARPEDVPRLMDTFGVETRIAFQSLRDVWADKLKAEEVFANIVLQEKETVLREMWTQVQQVTAVVFALAADARSTYVGQATRLKTLAEESKDADWHRPEARVDLKWHAAIRLYNAFCRHAALPRFKLNASLPRKLGFYLRALVKGATEEEREGIDFLEARLEPDDDTDEDSGDEEEYAAMAHTSRMPSGRKKAKVPRDTCSKRLGQFLRDPGVWWSGFHEQWQNNELTLARRWWRRCERGQPANDEELRVKFRTAGERWRKGKSVVAWQDIKSGTGSQWGGANWGERVSWVHTHLHTMAKSANASWREFGARRAVMTNLNTTLRSNLHNTMLWVGKTVADLQLQAMQHLQDRAMERERTFRADIARLTEEEVLLCRQLEKKGEMDANVTRVLHTMAALLRPSQLTSHRRALQKHQKAINSLIDSVSSSALLSAK